MADWPPEFEVVLLPYLEAAGEPPLPADVPLVTLGLDSMGVVGLIVDLEEQFGFSFPEEDVAPSSFHTARTLWSVVSRGGGAGGRSG